MPDYRVLVVDDNPSMRKLLGMVLKQIAGIQADFAGNGLEAIALHNTNQYDIILLDNAMPEMTGLEFLRKYRDALEASDTAVIMVTAAADQEIVTAARNSEIRLHDLVVKPFDIRLMSERVQKIVDRQKAQGRRTRAKFKGETAKPAGKFTPNLNGKMLSLGISVSKNIATASLSGMLLNDDRGMIIGFIQSLPAIPGDILVLDLSSVVGIDEFGLGTLLFVNGMAASAGKKTYLMAENSMVWERIRKVGIPEIVPMCGQWSGVPAEGQRLHS